MVDGAALLAAMMHGLRASGTWGERGTNLLDTGAWFYEVYETADGGYISFGSPSSRSSCQEMLRLTGLADDVDGRGPCPTQSDRDSWPAMKERMAGVIKTRTRDEWCALLEGTDACFAPVLEPGRGPPAPPQPRTAATFTEVAGVVQPAPAPRFSRTRPEIAGPPPRPASTPTRPWRTGDSPPRRSPALRAAGAIR